MTQIHIHPHYTSTLDPDPIRRKRIAQYYEPSDAIEIEDRILPGKEDLPDIPVRIYYPKGVDKAPMIMNIHGGGFRTGSYNSDNNRVSYFAEKVPAVVVSLNYRLLPEHHFPDALMDCNYVWNWMYDHAEEIRGDREHMGIYATSAGGNLAAGLAFYLRDHGGPKIALNALNVPLLGQDKTTSLEQLYEEAPVIRGKDTQNWVADYLGQRDGSRPSYYMVPNEADNFDQLPSTLVVVGEYDPLRDYGQQYIQKLQAAHVPTELYVMPRVGHGFDNVHWAPMTRWIHDGIVMSYQREFGMLHELEDPKIPNIE